ncbi:MAG TPA: beta-(1-6) glucans synthase [Xanthobacteraceae bacterium]
MGAVAAVFAAVAGTIMLAWQWLGSSVAMPPSPFSRGEKIPCISYAPFRSSQSPFGADVPIDPGRIEQDLAQLKPITDCVRTYSIDHGLDRIAPIAQRYGMKVLQGLWLSSFPELNRKQIETTLDLAKRFPDTIAAIVVGNEVLLRGEMSPADLAQTIRRVKAQVAMPVTYADVWEFWLRYGEISREVDFITIHILPYWEDIPIPSGYAALHVDAIRRKLVAAFPGKDIFIGEFGWPSAGRMREGALPSYIDQAQAMHEVLAAASRGNYRVNLIEAYDQPWKRELEGTVGGHWGLFDGYRRVPKFAWGGSVSNHPLWIWQATAGLGLAAVTFLAAFVRRRQCGAMAKTVDPRSPTLETNCLVTAGRSAGARKDIHPVWLWVRVAVLAAISGTLIGLTIVNVPLESLTLGDWARSFAWVAVALLSPVLSAAALASATRVPAFAQVLGRKIAARLDLAIGFLLIALGVLSLQAALGLVFDPRYRDFPFAPLIGAVAPLLFLGKWRPPPQPPLAELIMGLVALMAAACVVWNESFANWQASLFAAGLIALALILFRACDAQS